MENELVVDERAKWVRRGALVIQVVGVLLILWALISVGLLWWVYHQGFLARVPAPWLMLVNSAVRTVDVLLYGVAALALAQLLRYVFGQKRDRGRLLVLAPKGLVAWAAVSLAVYIVDIMQYTQYPNVQWSTLLSVAANVVPIARAVMLVSIASILRKALPIVEESRSLV